MFPVHLHDRCGFDSRLALGPMGALPQAQKDAIHPTPVFELLGLALEEFVDKAIESQRDSLGPTGLSMELCGFTSVKQYRGNVSHGNIVELYELYVIEI